jgi:hypothetical protein
VRRRAPLDLDNAYLVYTSERYRPAGQEPLMLESTFLLGRATNQPRILAYVNRRRVAAALSSL